MGSRTNKFYEEESSKNHSMENTNETFFTSGESYLKKSLMLFPYFSGEKFNRKESMHSRSNSRDSYFERINEEENYSSMEELTLNQTVSKVGVNNGLKPGSRFTRSKSQEVLRVKINNNKIRQSAIKKIKKTPNHSTNINILNITKL
jgi:hypothetical protein